MVARTIGLTSAETDTKMTTHPYEDKQIVTVVIDISYNGNATYFGEFQDGIVKEIPWEEAEKAMEAGVVFSVKKGSFSHSAIKMKTLYVFTPKKAPKI